MEPRDGQDVDPVQRPQPPAAAERPAPPGHLALGVLLTALLAALGVHVWSLLRYPAPYLDEVWILSRAFGWLHTGVPFGQLDVGVLDLTPEGWRVFGLTGTVLQSLALVGAGEVSLAAARAESLLVGAALLGVMFVIGRTLADARLGALVALLTACSRPFFDSAHLARPDIFAALFAYGALALHLLNVRRSSALAALAGALIGIGSDVHPNAVLLAVPIGVLFVMEEGLSVLRRRHFWSFVVCAAAAIILPLVMKVLPDPQGYAAGIALLFGIDHAPPLWTWDFAVLARSLRETATLVRATFDGGAPLLLACPLWMALRRDVLCRRTAVVAGCVMLMFVALVRSKKIFYAIAFGPALDLAIAACLFQVLFELRARPVLRIPVQLCAVVMVALLAFKGVPAVERNGYDGYIAAQERLNTKVRHGDSVMGCQQYWLGLQRHAFYSWEGLAYFRHAHPGTSLEAAFAVFKPDILIIDQEMGQFISDRPRARDVFEYLRLPAREMTALLHERGRLLDSFPSIYGQTMVFRMRWSD